MLTNINLLPEKEKKNPFVFITFFILIVVCVAAFLGVAYLYTSQKEALSSVENRVVITQKVQNKLEQQTQEISNLSNYLNQYQTAVSYVKKLPHSTGFLLKHFGSLLPSTGSIINLDYENSHSVYLIAHFDSLKQASQYLSALNGVQYLNKVQLTKVTSQDKGFIAEFSLSVNEAAVVKAQEEGE